MLLVGCRCGPPVDTIALHHENLCCSSAAVAEFDRLAHLFGQALAVGDSATIGQIATESAVVNQGRLPKPQLRRLQEISTEFGVIGVQLAHSGAVAGILFDAAGKNSKNWKNRAQQCRDALRSEGFTLTLSSENIGVPIYG